MSYNHYRGRCVGRVMAFLYAYSHRADSWYFNDQAIFLDNKCNFKIATYTWNSDVEGDPNYDVPTFKFSEAFIFLAEQQRRHKAEVIESTRILSNGARQ